MVTNRSQQRHDTRRPIILAVRRLRSGRLLTGRLVTAPDELARLTARLRLTVPIRPLTIRIAQLLAGAQRLTRLNAFRCRLLTDRHTALVLTGLLAQLTERHQLFARIAQLYGHIAGARTHSVVFAVDANLTAVTVVLAQLTVVHTVLAALHTHRPRCTVRRRLHRIANAVLTQLPQLFAQLSNASAHLAQVLAGLAIVHGLTGVQIESVVFAEFAQLLADVARLTDDITSVYAELTESEYARNGQQLQRLSDDGRQRFADVFTEFAESLFARIASIAQVLVVGVVGCVAAGRYVFAGQSDIFAQFAVV